MKPRSPHSAILILAFNRPDHMRRLLDALRPLAPQKVYVAVDGPRKSHPTDESRCEEVRSLYDSIDWKCEKHALFQKTNKGCQRAVSEAITWFFTHEQEGIILEDDCIPNPSFFPYCDELLARYRDDTRVMHISGNSFSPPTERLSVYQDTSYHFSCYPHCWGWATWKRAWDHLDLSLSAWPTLRHSSWLQQFVPSLLGQYYWKKIFTKMHARAIDSWALAWVYSCWKEHGLCIHPTVNLVTNVGFGKDSTHTRDTTSPLANLPAATLPFPLTHPSVITVDTQSDAYDQRVVYEQRTMLQLLAHLRRRLLPQ